MTGRVHTARIHWSPELIKLGLPEFAQTIDPAWFTDARDSYKEGWSLVCDFDVAPARQGSPSTARVRFFVEQAPHDRLRPGVSLWMFERATQKHARVEIVD